MIFGVLAGFYISFSFMLTLIVGGQVRISFTAWELWGSSRGGGG